MYVDDGAEVIVLPRQQGLELELLYPNFERVELLGDLLENLRIALGHTHEIVQVTELFRGLLERGDDSLQVFESGDDGLRLSGSVPEAGLGHLGL